MNELFFLLALLAIPLLALLWRLQRDRRRQYALRHPGATVVGGIVGRAPAWRRGVAPALLALAAVALSIALARSQATVDVPVERASVVLVTDESGSMLAEDVAPSRLEAAQAAAQSFLDEIPDELLVGAVSYSTDVQATRSTRPSTGWKGARPTTARPRRRPSCCCPTARRRRARTRFRRLTAPAASASRCSPSRWERRTASSWVRTASRSRCPPDPGTLREIAERSGGRAFAISDADALQEVYEDLGFRIGTRPEQREVSAAFAGAGSLLLLGGLGTGLRWRGRLA